MMTLSKPVTRKLENTSDGHGRHLIVQLMPGISESIRIREAGRRTWYEVPLSRVYKLGAEILAEANRSDKKGKRKVRRSHL